MCRYAMCPAITVKMSVYNSGFTVTKITLRKEDVIFEEVYSMNLQALI
jgi:hypothetical protein